MTVPYTSENKKTYVREDVAKETFQGGRNFK